MNEVEKLSKIAQPQQHAAYAEYTHGLSSKCNYLFRVTDWDESQFHVLESLEKAIQSRLIPALTGQPSPGEHTREMLALPAQLGGLSLTNPIASEIKQQSASQQIIAPLINRIINKDHQLGSCHSTR